ncbi:MAG TPA: APC family permease [Chitinophagales bacterium]|nr:APC family permease [Chitinophagales bacterium]
MSKELKREVSLLQATSINMIDMVGIGPFVTIPLVIADTGSHFLWAWILGALIAFTDAFIWSELGSAFPQAGGSYNFLKESYGKKWGRLLSFLYVWQTSVQAPLVIASGAIGFSQYASFIFHLDDWGKKILSGGIVIVLVILLYREIKTIGKISVVLWISVIAIILWIIIGGMSYNTPVANWFSSSIEFPELSSLFFVALGHASVKTVYSYLGYYNVCHIGGEIKNPESNIPKSIFISITGITTLYLLLNLSIVRVIPWQQAQKSEFIVSTFINHIYGPQIAIIATVMILLIAFSSLFAVMLGYSRVPYAAAVDGQFFSVFGKLHPTKNFPYISLLALGGAGFVFSLLFRLGDVITAVLAMRIVVQFIGQAIGVLLLRERTKGTHLPKKSPKRSGQAGQVQFRMPLYPLPVIVAVIVWIFIFYSTGIRFMVSGFMMIYAGVRIFYIKDEFRGNTTASTKFKE